MMYSYKPSVPRTALGLAAIALTTITLVLSVFVPVHMGTNAAPTETVIADAPTRVERIDVIAVRQSVVASTNGGTVRRKLQEG